jgi:diguanylate cyclase (GGDEF)-like protein/PAS domain S-box-containing protein
MHTSAPISRISLGRQLLPLVYGLVALIVLILGLTWGSLQIQITLAGFLNGESLWSKAQKQAVIELQEYVTSGDPADLQKFKDSYSRLKADVAGRDAIASGHYDKTAVVKDFKRGGVIPQAIPGIIFLFDHFPSAPYMRQAMEAWYSVGPPIKELDELADRLRRVQATSRLSPAEQASALQRIRVLNEQIGPRANKFSMEMARGAAWAGNMLFYCVLGATALALCLWLLMARRVLAGIRGTEERYRLLFDSATDAIMMVDERSGRILDANRTAGAWMGREPEALRGAMYAQLFDQCALREVAPGGSDLSAADRQTRPVETHSSMTVWGNQAVRQAIIRDISERVEGERSRRIAAEALANIAEGVLITDAGRRVVSANAAATTIAGCALESLLGAHLEDARSMPDGGPLPATIWDTVKAGHHWSGEVLTRRRDGSVYPERLSVSAIPDANQRILHYVAVFNDISVAKADQHRLEQQASHDQLTGLVNRMEFERRCDAAIERAAHGRHAAAVLFVDLDAFKIVNDSYSHAVGDRLLKQVADRILAQLRSGDVAGRIGGDEFTLLLPRLALREDAAPLAARLLAVLSEPFRIDEYEMAVSASIGIAGFPLDGSNAQTLIANADAAMYAAKSEERNTWRFYAPMMQADSRHRMQLAMELRQARMDSEFRLVYQPCVEMSTGRFVAAEALLRWQHPDRGEVMPGEFIPIAESTGLIHRIDEWVMNAVLAQIHAWDQSNMPRIRVALNVSARWFGHPGFVDSVQHALQAHAVAAERVVLEITEGAMLQLGEATGSTMRALHALGVGVAIDDFGTGYASMAYLKLPAITYLKIDRSFVADLPGSAYDAAITSAILAVARSLELTTIAEGVETEAQHEFLVDAGCTEGQGYLYSYPLPPETLARMLRPARQLSEKRLKLVPPWRSQA